MYDLVIKGGRVLDGSGTPWFWGDIGVKDGKITALARVRPGEPSPLAGKGKHEIDAAGHIVSPGFIDIHSHSDFPLLINPTADSKVLQGVTTEITGQCGHAPAPLTEASLATVKGNTKEDPGIDWNWRSYGEYLDRLERQGISVNMIGLVGHSTVRIAAMNYDARKPTADEMKFMKKLVRESMEQGAFGLSTGLIYTPASYSDTAELIDLAKSAAECGGLYFTHMRGEGEEVMNSIAESVEVGLKANIPVQVAHLKAYGLARGQGADLLTALEKARRDGVDITADQYPYIASSTGLGALLPPWAHEGGRAKMLERLADPATRAKIKYDMLNRLPGWGNDFRLIPWTDVMVARCDEASFTGKRIQQIADEQGKEGFEMAFDILQKIDAGTSIVIFGIKEEDVRLIMQSPLVMAGSDGSALNVTGPLSKGQPHPRNYGTFVRILGYYVREQKVLTLENAVRRMTSAPANRMGLKDRGQLREGWAADIVVFDPDTVIDTSTFEKPHQYPIGIDHVIVNGVWTVNQGKHTGALGGKVLRSH